MAWQDASLMHEEMPANSVVMGGFDGVDMFGASRAIQLPAGQSMPVPRKEMHRRGLACHCFDIKLNS